MRILRDGISFLGVGAIQLVLDAGLYIALSKAGVALGVANLCARAAGACCGYWLNGRVTFLHRAQPRVHIRIVRYVLLWCSQARPWVTSCRCTRRSTAPCARSRAYRARSAE